ncbi:YolD-like family protein [Sporosarcina sp. ANT_H38]|uniref:YolD-like family protein n=1 Tax=Sporosarcina sp. ANT_H38 TaxID=2597358 RepID=UPI0011F2C51E|nr:YolD-like family protein [Sporosarcina sp. ANT_H38]KAA0944049.1 YolD-like family protein [Sporosarcina sp. ANT_H38]
MLENIRDRGTKKWTAMMLPEHIVELNKWMDKDHYEDRPELSEWDLQSIQDELEVSYKWKCQTLIKTWKNGKIMTRGGIIEGIDLRTMIVMLDNPFGLDRIPVSDIIGVRCEE